jgi:hypothetical protein
MDLGSLDGVFVPDLQLVMNQLTLVNVVILKTLKKA